MAFSVPLLDYLRRQFIATVLRASKTIAAAAVAFTPFTLLAAKSNRAPSSDSNGIWFFILFCLPALILFAFFLAYRHRLLLTYKWALFIGYFVSIGVTYAISQRTTYKKTQERFYVSGYQLRIAPSSDYSLAFLSGRIDPFVSARGS